MPDEEVFDIVDHRDMVIGQALRSEVHNLGLWHRAVHILVFNGRGELFLQKRSMSKDTFPGAWDSSAAGHLGAGEGYEDSASRELQEELGLSRNKPLEYLFKLNACPETAEEFIHVYRVENEGPFTLNPEEIEEGGWFTPEKITSWIADRSDDFPDAFKLIWKIYSERYITTYLKIEDNDAESNYVF